MSWRSATISVLMPQYLGCNSTVFQELWAEVRYLRTGVPEWMQTHTRHWKAEQHCCRNEGSQILHSCLDILLCILQSADMLHKYALRQKTPNKHKSAAWEKHKMN